MEQTLKRVKQTLQELLKKWNWESEQNIGVGSTTFKLSALITTRNIVNELSKMNLFDTVTAQIKESVIFTTANDTMVVQYTEGVQLSNNMATLKHLLENFQEILMKSVPKEDVNSINIKLPEVNDFDELSSVARDIHIALFAGYI